MIFQNLGFTSQYSCEVLPGLPATTNLLYQFYRQGQRSYSEGLVVRVTPNAMEPWIGNFLGDEGISGIYACPSEVSLCVIARGQGYLVSVNEPTAYEIVRSYPIKDVRSIPDKRMIVFADYTKMTAYGVEGFIWETARLSWDGLRITDITSNIIRGMAWDSPQDKEIEFAVDLRTGRHEGGSSPEKHMGTS